MNNDIIWRQRKRLWCRLPWTFTIYSFSKDRFFVEKGMLSKKYEELRFYRVLDISMQKSFLQRIFGLGSIFLTGYFNAKIFSAENFRSGQHFSDE